VKESKQFHTSIAAVAAYRLISNDRIATCFVVDHSQATLPYRKSRF